MMPVHSYLHPDTQTYTHILLDTRSQQCAIIDPVLDYDEASGHTSTQFIDAIIAHIQAQHWQLTYIIDTHAHADHLTAAHHVKTQLGGSLVIGEHITQVQRTFRRIYNLDLRFKTDASQFDILTTEGSELPLGSLTLIAMHVPGHTPADMAYLVYKNDAMPDIETGTDTDTDTDIEMEMEAAPQAVFVGDTLFAPDVGTARCDFPDGDAVQLYRSIQRLLSLPEHTPLYLCHDYPPEGRQPHPSATVGEQQRHNIHVKQGISESEFVAMRQARDATLNMPRLIIPAVQVNIRAGQLPEPENNGIRYLKIPLNTLN